MIFIIRSGKILILMDILVTTTFDQNGLVLKVMVFPMILI